MTTREMAEQVLKELPEEKVPAALEALREFDPVVAAFRDAPVDDEPWTEDDEVALAEVEADREAGVPSIPLDEIKRKYELQ